MPRRPARKNRALAANVSIYRSSRKAHTAARVHTMMKHRQNEDRGTMILELEAGPKASIAVGGLF